MENDSFAKSIYEANNRRGFEEGRDELGIPITDDGEYLAKRAWLLNVMSGAEYGTIDRIHRRSDGLYVGEEKIEETLDNAYKLSQYKGTIKKGVAAQFWAELKKMCPKLNTKYLQIDDYSLWRIDTGELVRIPQDPEEYRKFMANLDW